MSRHRRHQHRRMTGLRSRHHHSRRQRRQSPWLSNRWVRMAKIDLATRGVFQVPSRPWQDRSLRSVRTFSVAVDSPVTRKTPPGLAKKTLQFLSSRISLMVPALGVYELRRLDRLDVAVDIQSTDPIACRVALDEVEILHARRVGVTLDHRRKEQDLQPGMGL